MIQPRNGVSRQHTNFGDQKDNTRRKILSIEQLLSKATWTHRVVQSTTVVEWFADTQTAMFSYLWTIQRRRQTSYIDGPDARVGCKMDLIQQ